VAFFPFAGFVDVSVPFAVTVPQLGMPLNEVDGAQENPNPPKLKPTKIGSVCVVVTFPALSVAV
jgi:hypothetical protein